MNILFLTTHLNTGGITGYLYTLTKGLIRRGHRIFIVASGGEREKDLSKLGAEVIVLNIATKSELNPKIYFALTPLLQLINKEHIDIIHAHTRITQVMGALLKCFSKKVYLSTCHGFFKTRLSRWMIPCWGDAAIAISPSVREHLKEDFRVEDARNFLITNGVDCEEFQPVPGEQKKKLRSQYGLKDEPTIGIIARLSSVKGHAILIEAMTKVVAQIPSVKLLIVGEGKIERKLRQLVEELNLKRNIFFYPVVNKTAEVLSLLDVFVFPSLQEGLGLSLMEAQAAGFPVVASNVGGIPHLIEHGQTGLLVNPNDVSALAEAIIYVLNNRQEALRMGKKARAFIQQNFSAEKMIEETSYLYERLLNGKIK